MSGRGTGAGPRRGGGLGRGPCGAGLRRGGGARGEFCQAPTTDWREPAGEVIDADFTVSPPADQPLGPEEEKTLLERLAAGLQRRLDDVRRRLAQLES